MIERICGIAGAIAFSQAPLFVQQYRHQMVGHVAELQRQVAAMQDVALQGNKTLEAFILKFISSDDSDFRAQGLLMQTMVQRWHSLSDGLFALQHATVWERPFVFLRYLDSNVVRDTYRSFSPGLPLTLEGVLYASFGLLVGICLYRLLRGVLRAIGASFHRRPKQVDQPSKQVDVR